MGFIAIVGSGPIGGAVAHKLAERDRVPEVRLIDAAGPIAEGKALDIRQSAPIEGFSTRVTFADSVRAAIGANVIVIADDAATQKEHSGEAGLAMLRQLLRSDKAAPIVCAGAAQNDLIALAIGELHAPRRRVLGSAPLALESALRAMAGLLLDASGVEVSLRVVGVPPHAAVVAWEEAAAFGLPLSAQLSPHLIAGLTARIPGLWPPGPYTLGSAAARTVEAIFNNSRRRFSCFVSLDRGPRRNGVASMLVGLGNEGVRRVFHPTLTRQEQTMLDNALETSNPGPRDPSRASGSA
jgi:malate dehydrogenase